MTLTEKVLQASLAHVSISRRPARPGAQKIGIFYGVSFNPGLSYKAVGQLMGLPSKFLPARRYSDKGGAMIP